MELISIKGTFTNFEFRQQEETIRNKLETKKQDTVILCQKWKAVIPTKNKATWLEKHLNKAT